MKLESLAIPALERRQGYLRLTGHTAKLFDTRMAGVWREEDDFGELVLSPHLYLVQ